MLKSAPKSRNGDQGPHRSLSSFQSKALDEDWKILRKILKRKRKCRAQAQGPVAQAQGGAQLRAQWNQQHVCINFFRRGNCLGMGLA